MAFDGAHLQILPGAPRAGMMYAAVLSGLLNQQKQQQAADEAAKQQQVEAYLKPYMSDPETAQKAYQSLPDNMKPYAAKLGMGIGQQGLMTPDQQLARQTTQAKLAAMQPDQPPQPPSYGGGGAGDQGPTQVMTSGVSPQTAQMRFDAWVSRRTQMGTPPTDAEKEAALTQITQGDPGLAEMIRIKNKQQMDAKDAATVPTENALKQAQTKNYQSETQYRNGPQTALTAAQAAKARQEVQQGASAATMTAPDGTAIGGSDYLKSLPPDVGALLTQIGNYQRDINSVASFRGKQLGPSERYQLAQMVARAFPDYDQKKYQAAQKLLTSYTAGPDSSTVKITNQLIEHLKQLNDLVPQVDNGRFKAANYIGNQIAVQMDNPAVNKWNQTALAAASELAKIYKTGQGSTAAPTKDEIQHWLDLLNVNAGPKTQRQGIAQALDLIGAPVAAVQSKWKAVMGDRPLPISMLNPQSAAALKGLGLNEIGGVSVDELTQGGPMMPPKAGTPSQQYKFTATGQNGQRIGSNDGNTWVDLATGQRVQ